MHHTVFLPTKANGYRRDAARATSPSLVSATIWRPLSGIVLCVCGGVLSGIVRCVWGGAYVSACARRSKWRRESERDELRAMSHGVSEVDVLDVRELSIALDVRDLSEAAAAAKVICCVRGKLNQ